MSAGTKSCLSDAISIAAYGTSRRATSQEPTNIPSRHWWGLAVSPEALASWIARQFRAKAASAIEIIRQFQSETDAIREAPEPRWARITVITLAGLIVSLTA